MADRTAVSIEAIIAVVLADAADRGISRVAEFVAYYRYGRDGVIPPDWERFADAQDPEYQRLKAKFGGDHGR